MSSLTHVPQQSSRLPAEETGLEIIEAGLERRGILPVEELVITDSGMAIYRIRTSSTNGSLEKAIKRGSLDRIEATRVTLDALRVVSEMHDDKELEAHGDINPGNIFVDHDHDTAAISGFYNTVIDNKALAIPGLRAVLMGGRLQGPPRIERSFTAPEVIKGARPDSRSDVYEGARTILYALHGTELKPTVETDEFMGSLQAVPPPELSGDFPAATPNSIRFVVQHALDPRPENRPAMGELVNTVGSGLAELEAAA